MDKQVFKPQNTLLWLPLVVIIPQFIFATKTIDLSVGLLILLLGLIFPLVLSSHLIHILEIDNQQITKVNSITKKATQVIPYTIISNIEIRKVGRTEQLNITTQDRKLIVIGLDIYPDKENIIKRLQSFVNFERDPITLNNSLIQDDIGQRPVHIIGIVIALFLLGLIFEKLYIHAWHGSSESMFSWFFISFPIGAFLSYLWIKGEGKATPIKAALVTGILLGGVLDYNFLLINRWNNEQQADTRYYGFRLDEQNKHYQQWTPMGEAQSELIFHDGYVQVHDVWDGYTNNFQLGKTYKIAVVKGNLNDIFFKTDAFKNAVLVEK